jgi:hypothetical protein
MRAWPQVETYNARCLFYKGFYKGFSTFASNKSPRVYPAAINPDADFFLLYRRSASSLVHAVRQYFLQTVRTA